MLYCPNKNSHEYQALENAVGSKKAHYLWHFYEGNVPLEAFRNSVPNDYKIFYQTTPDVQQETVKGLLGMHNNIKQVLVGEDVEYEVNGELGYTRTTTKTKKLQKKNFGKSTKSQEAEWAINKEGGTLFHKIASARIKDSTFGKYNTHVEDLNSTELNMPASDKIVKSINNAVDKLILEASKAGDILLTEVKIADIKSKIAGTADIIRVHKNGKVSVYDFKTLQSIKLVDSKTQEWDLQLGEYRDILSSETNVMGKALEVKKMRIIPMIRQTDRKAYPEVFNKLLDFLVKSGKDKFSDADLQPYLADIYSTFSGVSVPIDLETKTLDEIPILSERTGDPNIDQTINNLVSQIAYNDSQMSKLPKAKKAALQESNKNKRQLVRKLQTKAKVSEIIKVARVDLAAMDEMIRSGKYDADVNYQDYKDTAEFYTRIQNLFSDKEFADMTTAERGQVYAVSGYAQSQLKAIRDHARKQIMEEVEKKTNIVGQGEIKTKEDILTPVKESGIWGALTMGISTSQHPLLAATKKLVNRAFNAYRNKSVTLKEKLVDALNDLKKEGGSLSGVSLFDSFLQKNAEGKLTGNMVDEVVFEYWKDRSDAAKAEDIKWFKEYTDVNFELYKKNRENYLNFLEKTYKPRVEADYKITNEDKVASKKELNELAKEYAKKEADRLLTQWTFDNGTEASPNPIKYNTPKKNTKYIDKAYLEIQASPAKKKFYDLYVETMKELNGLLPNTDYIRPNFIANFQAGLIDMAAKTGIKDAVKNDWFQWDSIAVDYDNTANQITSISGEPLRHIPIQGISILRDEEGRALTADNKSYDLAVVLQKFADSVYKYAELQDIETTVKMIAAEVKEQEVPLVDKNGNPIKQEGKNKTKKIINSTYASQIDNYINKTFYGINTINGKPEPTLQFTIPNTALTRAVGLVKKNKEGEYEPRVISGIKIIDNLIKYVAVKNLGFNIPSSAVNMGQGLLAVGLEASKGRFFTPKDALKAFQMLSTMDKKAKLLREYFDTVHHEFTSENYKQLSVNKLNHILSSDQAFFLQEWGETAAQDATLLAVLSSGKMGISLDDFKVVDDKLVLTKELSDDQVAAFRARIKALNATLVGNYDPEDFMQAKSHFVGRLLLQHRTWLPAMLNERWGTERYDYTLEKMIVGRYRLLGRKVGWQLIKEFATGGLLKANKDALNKKYSEEAVAGMKANITEASMMLILFILGRLAFEDDEPEDDTGIQRFARRTANRLIAKMTFFSTGWVTGEAYEILISPVPASSIIEDTSRLINNMYRAGWWWELEDGRKEGTPGKYARRFIPYLGQGERFYNQYVTGEEQGWFMTK